MVRIPTFADAYSVVRQTKQEAGIAKAEAGQAFLLEQVAEPVAWEAALAEFVARLVDDVASMPAFASASHDCDEWPLERDRKLGNEHPYNDDNGSRRSESSRNAGRGTFGLCTLRYASISASYRHSEASPDNGHLHDDTSRRASTITSVAVDDVEPAADPILGDS